MLEPIPSIFIIIVLVLCFSYLTVTFFFWIIRLIKTKQNNLSQEKKLFHQSLDSCAVSEYNQDRMVEFSNKVNYILHYQLPSKSYGNLKDEFKNEFHLNQAILSFKLYLILVLWNKINGIDSIIDIYNKNAFLILDSFRLLDNDEYIAFCNKSMGFVIDIEYSLDLDTFFDISNFEDKLNLLFSHLNQDILYSLNFLLGKFENNTVESHKYLNSVLWLRILKNKI